jgi:hypothetical protein
MGARAGHQVMSRRPVRSARAAASAAAQPASTRPPSHGASKLTPGWAAWVSPSAAPIPSRACCPAALPSGGARLSGRALNPTASAVYPAAHAAHASRTHSHTRVAES